MKAIFTPDLKILLLGVPGFCWLFGLGGGVGVLLLVGCVSFVSSCFGFCFLFALGFFPIIC